MTGACEHTETELSPEEAFAVLEPYFVAVREVFVDAGAPVGSVVLEVAPWVHDGPRHFAATAESGRTIVCAPELAQLPEETVLAILSHEFGHAEDFSTPGRYFVDDDGELLSHIDENAAALEQKMGRQARIARMKRWGSRDHDMVERTADAIAKLRVGREIGYAGPCSLQSFSRGVRPRPRGLV